MKSLEKIREVLSRHKGDLTQKYKVKEIGIFGSFVRGEQRKGSDVDILVEMEPEYQTFKNYMGLKFFLEEILDNKVDLVLKDVVKEQLKDRILSEVISGKDSIDRMGTRLLPACPFCYNVGKYIPDY